MVGNLVNALWITLIGMGLVFLAILALWGMMALIVRLTAERPGADAEAAEAVAAAEEAEAVEEIPDTDRKRRAAAAAVAVAVALQAQRSAESLRAAGPAGSVSVWQAAHRASQISQRVQTSRKKVVR